MSREFTSYYGKKVTIEDKPFQQGGQGAIHNVVSGSGKLVAKLYLTPEKAKEFHPKIEYMINNPPFGNAPQVVKESFIWPRDMLFDNNVFVGFVMQKVEDSIKSSWLSLSKPLQQTCGQQWQKFDRTNPDNLLVRYKICYNLIRVVDLLHQTGKYVLVDLKPDNVLIKTNGCFSVIDMDSLQICENQKLLFRATAYTSDYAPPEIQQGLIDFSKNIIKPNFDIFSLAVTLYQLIMSVHPFLASHKQHDTLAENIEHGLYVHGSKKGQLYVIPPVHNAFYHLPKNIQAIFNKALDHGHINPEFRPSLDEWAKVIMDEINNYSPGNQSPFVYAPKKAYKQSVNNPKVNNKARVSSPAKNKQKVNPNNGINKHRKVHKAPVPSYNPACYNANRGYNISKQKQLFNIKNIIAKKYKIAAIIILLIVSGFAVRNIVDRFSDQQIISENKKVRSLTENICGQYYGYIANGKNESHVAYLQIKQSPDDMRLYAMQIKYNAYEEPVFEELKVNNDNKIQSQNLGEGMIKNTGNGKTIIVSTEKNKLSWHFEK